MSLTLLANVFFLKIEAMQDMKRPFTSILRFTFGVIINYIIRWLFRLYIFSTACAIAKTFELCACPHSA